MRNERGSVLLMAMGVAAIVMILGTTVLSWQTSTLKEGQKIRMDGTIDILQQRLISAVNNDVSWNLTVQSAANNAELACFRASGNNCTAAAGQIAVSQINGAIAFPRPVGTSGFSINGDPCNTFNPGAGDDNCPFRIVVSIAAVCPAPPCMSVVTPPDTFSKVPPVQITAALIFNPANRDNFSKINPNLLQTVFVRGEAKNEASYMTSICASFQGVWNPATKKCVVPILEVGVCAPNFHLAGLTAANTANCNRSDLTNVHCKTSRNSMPGLSPWGEPYCGKFDK